MFKKNILLLIILKINMEENEIIIDEDPEVKSLNNEELLLYKYLKEENKSKIKSNINNEI